MATLDFVLAASLDPVQAVFVLAVVLVYRGPHPIIVAGAIAALVAETVMLVAADDYLWGELIAPRAVSCFVQAAALCWIVRAIRQGRGRVAPARSNPAPGGNGAATVAPLAADASLHAVARSMTAAGPAQTPHHQVAR
jgi:hypothetical protein